MRGDLTTKEKRETGPDEDERNRKLASIISQINGSDKKQAQNNLPRNPRMDTIIKQINQSGNFDRNLQTKSNSESEDDPDQDEYSDDEEDYTDAPESGQADEEVPVGQPIYNDSEEDEGGAEDNRSEAERLEQDSLSQNQRADSTNPQQPSSPQAEASRLPESAPTTNVDGKKDSLLNRYRKNRAEQQLKNQAANAAKNETKAAAKSAAKAAGKAIAQTAARAWAFLLANPEVAAVLIGIIFVLLAIAITFAIVLSNNTNASTRGQTITQPVDPLLHKDWILKILANAKDPSAEKQLSAAAITGLKADFQSIVDDPNFGQDIKNKAQEIIALLNKFSGPEDTTNGKNIISGIQEFAQMFTTIPKYPGTAQLPLKVSGTFGGVTPHGKSLMNTASSSKGHNVVYMSFGSVAELTCDAVDIVVPNNLWGKGVDVYPVFAGKVIAKRRLEQTAFPADVLVVEDSLGYRALYTDIETSLQVNDVVTLDRSIGKLSYRLLHFQIAYQNRCMVTTQTDKANWIAGGQKRAYGEYMIDHLKTIVGI